MRGGPGGTCSSGPAGQGPRYRPQRLSPRGRGDAMSAGPEKPRGLLGRLFRGGTPAAGGAEPAAQKDREAAAGIPATEAAAEAAPAATEPAAKQSWLARLKAGLTKTSSKLSDGITGLFTKRKLDAETLEELEDLLIEADLGVGTAMRITEVLSKGRYAKELSPEAVRTVLADEVERVLTPVAKPLTVTGGHKPQVILVVGVNGTGKTTTIGKLAQQFSRQGLKVMLAAGDTFRAAATEQLQIWGKRTGAAVVARATGADAAGLVFDALKEAQTGGYDVLLIDTAGRLQNKQALMDELEKVVRVIAKLDAGAPHDVLLVLDATTGQNALSQVEVFRDRARVTGLVMTKLDGTARGGILVAIAEKYGLPVHAIGVGEGVDDLQPFDPKEFARAIALG
ncbi:MAG TPA: signal recognition particle-docking protein FtsY [Hyphomicrobiaceae bacterium]|nr:signal recognition particle-docking protein FtsY [Hyphomicrobiaceae bacterium]